MERGSPDSPSSRRQQSTRMPPRSAPPAGNVCGEGVCGGAPNLGRARSRFHLTIFGASPSRCNSPAPKGGRSASPRRTRTPARTACHLHTSLSYPASARRPTDISGLDQFPRSDPPDRPDLEASLTASHAAQTSPVHTQPMLTGTVRQVYRLVSSTCSSLSSHARRSSRYFLASFSRQQSLGRCS